MRRRLFAVLIAATPFAAAAQAPTVAIEQPWSRAAMAGRNGAVYMTIVAKGAPDRLVSARSPAAERVEVHESLMDNGVMKMREIKGLAVEPGKPAKLVPGGNHVMLMNLKQPLAEGGMVEVTLVFEKAGEVVAKAPVAKAGAASAPDHAHHHR